MTRITSALFGAALAGAALCGAIAGAAAAQPQPADPAAAAATPCTQPAALGIAASFGIVKALVDGATSDRIVVRGTMNGRPVELVLRPGSGNCVVKKMSYPDAVG